MQRNENKATNPWGNFRGYTREKKNDTSTCNPLKARSFEIRSESISNSQNKK